MQPFSYMLSFAYLTSLIIVLAYMQPAYGESYSWTDNSGRTIYGSKPPKDAGSVKRLNTKPLSRYSSKKMLGRLGYKRSAIRKAATKSSKPKAEQIPSLLLHDDVEIKQDDAGQLLSCRVVVQNPSTEVYKDVNVAFEFLDGTLVPAVGPEEVSARSSAEYKLPAELLPMKLQVEESELDPNKPLVTRVMIHGTAD